jgi:hypothetical protein
MTTVRSAAGVSEEFEVKVGLHQGSGISPFLFAIVMDNNTAGVRKAVPWSMLFADDIVLVNEDRGELERELEDWRLAMETRGLRVSRSKTEGMTLNKQGNHPDLMLQGVRVPEVSEFKYLGSTFQENGECEREVARRIQVGWAGWKKVSGVLCDKNISMKVKGKIHKTVVWPAMMYSMETVGATIRQVGKLRVAEMRMLRMEMGITKMDKVRNESVRSKMEVENIEEKVREARLRWYGHVKRREDSYVGKKVLDMEVSGKRPRGRPKTRFMDVVREDMKAVGAREDEVWDRTMWRKRCKSAVATP